MAGIGVVVDQAGAFRERLGERDRLARVVVGAQDTVGRAKQLHESRIVKGSLPRPDTGISGNP